MWKKLVLGSFALLLMLAANVDLCCKVAVNGCQLDGLYAPSAADRSEAVAVNAAEEIVSGPARMPEVSCSYRLSLTPASGDSRVLTGRLLCAATGVKLAQGVFINGVPLGTVEDGSVLYEQLRGYIRNQMPNAAVFGTISGEVQIRPIYSRSNRDTDYDDMVLLITGMAPVIYLDDSGKLV